MNQELALEILLSGKSVFLTGPAGSGKTFVLNQFIKLARSDGKSVAVTATTGLAASHLGGTTIHSWAGIGILDDVPRGFLEHMSKTRREIIAKSDVLVIDEISMLHDYRLDMIDTVCRLVKEKPDVAFGGIQVVMSGDFFQLPPVTRGDARAGGFVVYSDSWRELDPVVCYLEDQYRHDDVDLKGILDAMRIGGIRRGHVEMLMERGNIDPDDENMTELYTTNVDVDKVNLKRLEELSGDEYTYTRSTTGSQQSVDSLQRSILASEKLRLKEGAFVMAIKNAQDKKYVNGSLGVVVDFEDVTNYPVVEFKNGRRLTVIPEIWEQRDGDKKRASISQVPLRLAWAITVHKSQGMTLDAARMDLSKAFVEGMGYVALSRVKNLQSLYLSGLNKMAIRVSDDAVQIDKSLRRKGSQDADRFRRRFPKPKKIDDYTIQDSQKTGSAWAERVAEMRKEHPNAFRPWSKNDDNQLKEMFHQGESLASISKQLGRQSGSITARLKKHFGEDYISA